MRKIFFVIIAVIAVNFYSSNKANAQCIEQGNVIVDASYGFPNLYTSILKAAYENSGTTQSGFKIGTMGPIGLQGEYLLSDKIGIGLCFTYANSSVEWTETATTTYNYKVSVPRIRVLPTFNFHFATSDALDPYFILGVGYSSWSLKYESNDPTFTGGSISSSVPVAWRSAIGLRYFFTDNIGARLEFGIGGALVLGGVSFKF
jgi:outer membrane protein W